MELGVWRMLIAQLCKVDQLSSQKQSDSVWHLSSLTRTAIPWNQSSFSSLRSCQCIKYTTNLGFSHWGPYLVGGSMRKGICAREGSWQTAVGSGSGTDTDYNLKRLFRVGGATSLWCSQFFQQVAQWSSIFGFRVVFYHVLSCFIKCETEKEHVSMF